MDKIIEFFKLLSTGELVTAGSSMLLILSSMLESSENKKEHEEVCAQISEILETIKDRPVNIHDRFLQLLELANSQSGVEIEYRKVKSCLVIMREMSNKSEEGQSNDPYISIERCQELLNSKVQPEDSLIELKLVAHVLHQENLIHRLADANSTLAFSDICPTEDFFWRTDHIFQGWNSEVDARSVCKLLLDKDVSDPAANTHELECELGWPPRRLNPALAYLYYNELIDQERELGGIKYVLPDIRLSEEAYLFINDESK
jgi:hypothetical protein